MKFRQMEPNEFMFKYYFVKWFQISVWISFISSIGTKYALGKVLFGQMVQIVPLLKLNLRKWSQMSFW